MRTCSLRLEVYGEPQGFNVGLSIDGEKWGNERFDFEFDGNARLFQVIEKIEKNICSEDDLKDFGSHLWAAIAPETIRSKIRELRSAKDVYFHLRLALPQTLQNLPWEALYDDEFRFFLSTDEHFCVIRDAFFGGPKEEDIGPHRTINLLAVAPQLSGLRVDDELKNLEVAVTNISGLSSQWLRGLVSPDAIREKTRSFRPDIFHFIGHGVLDDRGAVRIRLNSDEQAEFWSDAEPFSATFTQSGVKLAFLNCCYGGQVGTNPSMSGLGPVLMARGVPAVVAMRYPISDTMALRFSKAFYSTLMKGDEPGRIDIAVQEARNALYTNATDDVKRSFITPVFYVSEGWGKLFDIERLPEPHPVQCPAVQDISVPSELLDALKKKRCVPIVGSELVSPPHQRSMIRALSIRAIAEELSRECSFPDSTFVSGAESIGLPELAFQGISEFFVARRMRYALIDAIRTYCAPMTPTAAHLSLAKWPVPALFYTHFDGLMEAAFQVTQRSLKIVYRLHEPPDLQQNQQVLVLVRGTFLDEGSLVLTERDHDDLGTVIDRLPPAIEQTTTSRLGVTVLLLGVNPRDPTIRKLAKRLIRPNTNQGPAYFVCPNYTAHDEAYWKALAIIWIRAEPEDVVTKLTELVTGSE
jgi:hypothetical protein